MPNEFDSDIDILQDPPISGADPVTPAQTPKDPGLSEDVDIASLFGPANVAPKFDPGLTAMVSPEDFALPERFNGVDLYPWMRFHKFTLVKSVEELAQVVDAAIKHGRCALDTETEGLDTRIDYVDGKPKTRHSIVGYCLSVRGAGYYVPVRHKYDKRMGQSNPNVDLDGAEAQIRRLCLTAQPKFDNSKDPFSGPVTEPGKLVIYFWNAKFDHEMLWPVTGIQVWHAASFEDGMLAAYVDYSDDELGLKAHAMRRLSITDPEEAGAPRHYYKMIEYKDLFPKGSKSMQFDHLHPEDVLYYGCSDAICTELLCEEKKIKWDLTKEGLITNYDTVLKTPRPFNTFDFIYNIEKQASAAVREMERPRVLIALDKVEDNLTEAKHELADYESRLTNLARSKGFENFNPGSAQQLGEFLFGTNGLDITPKPEKHVSSGQYKTDGAVLEELYRDHPELEVLSWIVKYRQITKIVGTYLSSMSMNCDKDGRLRFSFVQTGAATGRFTAPGGKPEHGYSGIPIHGIPARDDPSKPKSAQALRRLFVSSPGYTFVKVDYAGQELRVVANISKEPVWIKEFLEGEGDLHTITAQAFFPGLEKTDPDFKLKRTSGKIANFSLIYGGGVQAIIRATKCDKVEGARKLEAFKKSVPTFNKWMGNQKTLVKKDLGVRTAFGRFIRIPMAGLKPGAVVGNKTYTDESEIRRIVANTERQAVNFPIQGTGADILKISLIKLHKSLSRLGWLKENGDDSVRMIMTVHDEIDFEIRHDRLVEVMPIIVDAMTSPGKTWEVPLVVEPDIGLSWEAQFSWKDVESGKIPMPEWLSGVQVGSGEKPQAQALEARRFTEEPVEVAPITSRSEAPAAGMEEVATFVATRQLLTTEHLVLLFEAASGSVRVPKESGTLFRFQTDEGEILVDPSDNQRVDPDRFAMKLRDRGLSVGTYTIRYETVSIDE